MSELTSIISEAQAQIASLADSVRQDPAQVLRKRSGWGWDNIQFAVPDMEEDLLYFYRTALQGSLLLPWLKKGNLDRVTVVRAYSDNVNYAHEAALEMGHNEPFWNYGVDNPKRKVYGMSRFLDLQFRPLGYQSKLVFGTPFGQVFEEVTGLPTQATRHVSGNEPWIFELGIGTDSAQIDASRATTIISELVNHTGELNFGQSSDGPYIDLPQVVRNILDQFPFQR